MSLIGDCFTCSETLKCDITSPEKVLRDFTCELYKPVNEPTYLARLFIRSTFGDLAAAQSIVNRERQQGGEPTDVDP